MRMPRWLVVSMLAASSLAILAVAGWWWLTWPARISRAIDNILLTENYDELPDEFFDSYRRSYVDVTDAYIYQSLRSNRTPLRPQSRSLMGLISARQDFAYGVEGH